MKRGLISFFYLFFEILVIVQGWKNMLGELAMDNLVIMSAFDNLMKVLETLLNEGITVCKFLVLLINSNCIQL